MKTGLGIISKGQGQLTSSQLCFYRFKTLLLPNGFSRNESKLRVNFPKTQRFIENCKILDDIVKNWKKLSQWHTVPEPKFRTREFYIGNLASGTNAVKVCEFLTDNKVVVITCEGIGTGRRDDRCTAFHVEEDYDKDTDVLKSILTQSDES